MVAKTRAGHEDIRQTKMALRLLESHLDPVERRIVEFPEYEVRPVSAAAEDPGDLGNLREVDGEGEASEPDSFEDHVILSSARPLSLPLR